MTHLSSEQRSALAPHVAGRTVFDLGAGPLCHLSLVLLELGAARVVAVDKDRMLPVAGVERRQVRFEGISDPTLDVAFVSLPYNRFDAGLLSLVRRAAVVAYLGSNTGATMCGWPGFFRELIGRELLAYVPERPRSLVVVGGRLERPRRPTGEELAGLTIADREEPLEFEEAEGLAGG